MRGFILCSSNVELLIFQQRKVIAATLFVQYRLFVIRVGILYVIYVMAVRVLIIAGTENTDDSYFFANRVGDKRIIFYFCGGI